MKRPNYRKQCSCLNCLYSEMHAFGSVWCGGVGSGKIVDDNYVCDNHPGKTKYTQEEYEALENSDAKEAVRRMMEIHEREDENVSVS